MNTVYTQAIATILVLLALVYWFAYRPYEIRTRCLQQSSAQYATYPGENAREVKIDIANQECLLRNGL